MDYNILAKNILQNIGGMENVNNITHCATRLRFILKDENKANDEKIKNVVGVRGLIKKGGQYPDPTIRFYKNGKAYLPCENVHEQAKVDGLVGWLKNDLEHYADTSFSLYLLRANRYTTLLAQELQEKKAETKMICFNTNSSSESAFANHNIM